MKQIAYFSMLPPSFMLEMAKKPDSGTTAGWMGRHPKI
jgi:hypothetical protein